MNEHGFSGNDQGMRARGARLRIGRELDSKQHASEPIRELMNDR